MAKRRLNRPLLIVLLTVVLVVFAGGIFLFWRWLPRDPGPYIARAEQLEANATSFEDLNTAAQSYEKAFYYDKRRDQRETWGIRAGDLYWVLGREDRALYYYGQVSKLPGNSPRGQDRLVRLSFYIANPQSSQRMNEELINRANALIQMAPDNPAGYLIEAVTRIRTNRPNDCNTALTLLDRLRTMQPNNPLGYYWAAVVLAQPQREAWMPRQDVAAADKLIAIVPSDADEATLARFQLYKVLYLRARIPALVGELTSDDERQKRYQELTAQFREEFDKIVDFSRMSRQEQEILADAAMTIGKRELAERIYAGWKNDLVAELMQFTDPPPRQEMIDRALQLQPISLNASVRLAQLYLNDPQRAGELNKLVEAGQAIELPSDRNTNLFLRQRVRQSDLAIIRARQLLAASKTIQEIAAASGYIRQIGDEYGPLVANNATFQRLAGQTAARMNRPFEAQMCLERALYLQDQYPGSRQEYIETVYALVEVYRSLDLFGRARKIINDKLLKSQTYYADVWALLLDAEVSIDLRDYERAGRVLDGLLKDERIKDQELLKTVTRMKARLQYLLNDRRGFLETMRTVDPDSAAQKYREAVFALQQNDPQTVDKSLALLQEALKANKAMWPAAREIASVYARRDEKDKALAVIDQFLADNSNDKRLSIAAKVYREQIVNGQAAAANLLRELAEAEETPRQRCIRLAEEAASQGNPQKAAAKLKEAEQLVQPQELNMFLDAAFRFLVRTGDLVTARTYYERLRDANVDAVGGRSYQALLLYSEGKYKEAVQACREVLSRRQADAPIRRLLARALFDGGLAPQSEVLQELRQSIDDSPTDRDGWRELVSILLVSSNPAEAYHEAERALQRVPNDPMLYQIWLNGQARTNPKRAIEELVKIVTARPDNLEARMSLVRLYNRENLHAEADAQLAQIQALLPKLDEAAKPAWVLNIATALADRGQPDKASAMMDELVKAKPNQPATQWAMGDFLRRQNKMDEAKAHYDKALSLNPPNMADYLFRLADFYHDWGGKLVPAIEALEEALKLHTTVDGARRRLLLQLANYRIEFDRLTEAAETLAELNRHWPNMVETDELEGFRLTKLGNWKEALDKFDAVIARSPERAARAYYQKGQLLVRQNPVANLNEAISNFEQALRYSPDLLDGQPFRELAELYMKNGAPAQALSALRRELARNPSDFQARHRLIQILDVERQERDLDAAVDEARQMFPDSPTIKMAAGRVAMRRYDSANPATRNEIVKAEALFREAITKAPKEQMAVLLLARSLAAQEKWRPLLDESQQWVKDAGSFPGIHIELAQAAEKLNLKDRMLEELSKAVDASNVDPGLMLQLGVTLRNKLGDAPAENWLKDCVRRKDSVPTRLMLAHYYGTAGHLDKAIAVCDEMLATSLTMAQEVDVLSHRAIIFQQSGRYQEAADGFERVMKVTTESKAPAMVLNNYAYLLADNLNQAEKAIPRAEAAVKATNPPRSDPRMLDTLGWCYIKAGQAARGIVVLEEAQQLLKRLRQDDLPIICYHLAEGYNLLNKQESALKMAEEAVKLYGDKDTGRDAEKARDLLKRLKEQ